MSRDINPFGLRMPQELKQTLTGMAERNKRSLNAEIVARLQDSITADRDYFIQTGKLPLRAEEKALTYTAKTELEQELLQIFTKLSVEKKLALISLFK